jgi:hypothetical protein
MGILKAEEFVGVALEYLKFYEHEGKARVRGYIPELPEGYEWDFSVHYDVEKQDDRNSLGGAYFTQNDVAPEQTLPSQGGTFDKTLYTNGDNISVLVLMCEIKSTKLSSGGYFWISFTQNEYSVDDRYGGYSRSVPFDPRGFIEW